MLNCQVCGAEIVGRRIVRNGAKPTIYCSRACNLKARTLRRRDATPPTRKECPLCCKMFTAHRYQLFCSGVCGRLAHAIREFERAHPGRHDRSAELQLPPPVLVKVRAANIRARRETADAIPSYDEYRRGRGIGRGADHPSERFEPDDFTDFGDESADLELAPC